jgi:hypothetical protein
MVKVVMGREFGRRREFADRADFAIEGLVGAKAFNALAVESTF